MSPEIFNAKSNKSAVASRTPANPANAVVPSTTTTTVTTTTKTNATGTPSFNNAQKAKSSRNSSDFSAVLAAEPECRNGWAAYAPKPVGVTFDTQMKDEKILMLLRQHPIVNVPWIIITIGMIFAPFLVFPLFMQYLPLSPGYVIVIWLSWYLITTGFVVESALRWLFNVFLITDERMIDIDFVSLINKQIDYAQLDKIQDVSVHTGGVLHSVVDIGSVFVQTAGEVPEFVFDNVAHPSRVAQLLDELVQEEQQEFMEGRVR